MMKLILLATLVAFTTAAIRWDSGSKRTHYGYQPGGYGNGDNSYYNQGYGYGDLNGYRLNRYNGNGGGYGYKTAGYGKPQYRGMNGVMTHWDLVSIEN